MNRAKAFVYMAMEDFGIAMAEAQAAGCPVIAYAQRGAPEIILVKIQVF
jgi:glycosyltransferase involved in cell wall biosynthesis